MISNAAALAGYMGEVTHRYPKIKMLATITRISAAPIAFCFRFRATTAPAPRSRYAKNIFVVKPIVIWIIPFGFDLILVFLHCTRLCGQKQGGVRKFTNE